LISYAYLLAINIYAVYHHEREIMFSAKDIVFAATSFSLTSYLVFKKKNA